MGYGAVTTTVIKLGKAAGDSARQTSVTKTIPKRGNHLIVPVSRVDVEKKSSSRREDGNPAEGPGISAIHPHSGQLHDFVLVLKGY